MFQNLKTTTNTYVIPNNILPTGIATLTERFYPAFKFIGTKNLVMHKQSPMHATMVVD